MASSVATTPRGTRLEGGKQTSHPVRPIRWTAAAAGRDQKEEIVGEQRCVGRHRRTGLRCAHDGPPTIQLLTDPPGDHPSSLFQRRSLFARVHGTCCARHTTL